MTTTASIETVKDSIRSLPPQIRSAYNSGKNMEQYLAEREKQLLFDLTHSGTSNPLKITDSFTDLLGLIRADFYQEYAAMLALWHGFKDSSEYAEALAAVDPLMEQLATLEAKATAEAKALAEKQNALCAAREAALEKAKLAAEQDPSVKAAEAALAKLRA